MKIFLTFVLVLAFCYGASSERSLQIFQVNLRKAARRAREDAITNANINVGGQQEVPIPVQQPTPAPIPVQQPTPVPAGDGGAVIIPDVGAVAGDGQSAVGDGATLGENGATAIFGGALLQSLCSDHCATVPKVVCNGVDTECFFDNGNRICATSDFSSCETTSAEVCSSCQATETKTFCEGVEVQCSLLAEDELIVLCDLGFVERVLRPNNCVDVLVCTSTC